MNVKPFWALVFCEADGSPSLARVGTAVLVGFACGWVSAVVKWTHALPELGGLSFFITALYGANKLAGAVSSVKCPTGKE